MMKAMIFDADGMLVQEESFSERFAQDFDVPAESIMPFFENEFQLCLVGKADLKIELQKYIDQWGWQGSVDSLIEYWFSGAKVDQDISATIAKLRKRGTKCFLATNQEFYRSEYFAQQLGFADIFDAIFCSAIIGYKKPQGEFFAAIAKQISPIRKNEVLFWDDKLENVNAAKQFGFQAKQYTNYQSFETIIKKLA